MKAAIVYARMGWAVVPLHSLRADGRCTCGHTRVTDDGPCECGDPKCTRLHKHGSIAKHPRLGDWARQATTDEGTVAEWLARWPSSNVGVATGKVSGFFVFDVDPEHGGLDSLARLVAQHGPLPRTVQAETGSRGSHYLFNMPDFPVSNSASSAALGDGLDIRGDGGQVVVAPSRSAKGTYRWVNAPWDVDIADAPEWLLSALRQRPRPASTSSGVPSERGWYPPATPSEIDEARAALEAHGPAIDGQGGGLHTVHAAAILTHDFAFSEEEAWPLFSEWNETCVPPWEPDDLRERLRRGNKYGKKPYGCRRPLASVVAAQKLIRDFQAEPGRDPFSLIDSVRPIAANISDPARRDAVAKELAAATGIGIRALALPKAAPVAAPPAQPGEIRVTPELHKMADESLKAIQPHVFARNGVLCEVVRAETTYIHDLEAARILDLMSACAVYVRTDADKGPTIQAPPAPVATILQARRTHPGTRVLEAVTTAPVFLRDGSLLRTRGYNAQARLFLEPSVDVDVPDSPGHDLARRAVAQFRDLLGGFCFATPADFSSWLAGLLSPLVKSAIGNAPTPMIIVSAPSAGAGKTLLAQTAARIVQGTDAELRPYNPRDPAEWGKRLTSFVKSAAPVNLFDDVNGHIGDEALDRLLTASTWSDRQLGASEAPPLPHVSTWWATGNNIEPVGATVRRVLVVRLEVMSERPQERSGFRHPIERSEYIAEHRSALLSAALTILRAYHCAGRPRQPLPAWGSFGAWSDLVRGALVWAGCEDPYATQRRATETLHDADHEAHDFWLSVLSACPDGRPASIVLTANGKDARGVLGLREDLTVHRLRHFLPRYLDKPRGGQRIRRSSAADGSPIYRVERISG